MVDGGGEVRLTRLPTTQAEVLKLIVDRVEADIKDVKDDVKGVRSDVASVKDTIHTNHVAILNRFSTNDRWAMGQLAAMALTLLAALFAIFKR